MTITNPYAGIQGVNTQRDLQVTEKANNDPNQMGVQDFMTLMVAQLRNQDPTKPQESAEFLSQIAQFGTVSGIEEMNGSLAGLAGSLTSNAALQAAAFVGRDVITSYSVGPLAEGGTLQGVVELPKAASHVAVQVKDANGQVVETFDIEPEQQGGAIKAGIIPFEWDGKDVDGKPFPEGVYSFSTTAIVNGESAGVATYTRVKIESVSMGGSGGEATLNLQGGATMALSQVREFH